MTRHLGLTLSLIALDKPWAPSELAFLFLLIFLSPCAPFGQVYKSTDFQCPLSSGYIPTHSCSPTLDHHLERSSFQQRLPGAPTLDGWDQMDQNHPSHPCTCRAPAPSRQLSHGKPNVSICRLLDHKPGTPWNRLKSSYPKKRIQQCGWVQGGKFRWQ